MDREKVIKGLHNAWNYLDTQRRTYESIIRGTHVTCFDDTLHAIDDALALLKAQEPRVMTLDEVKMLDSDYYYLESMRSPGKELREIIGTYGLTCVTWPSITWARQTMGDSGYGKTWRCWTSRPDEKTMEATPWN